MCCWTEWAKGRLVDFLFPGTHLSDDGEQLLVNQLAVADTLLHNIGSNKSYIAPLILSPIDDKRQVLITCQNHHPKVTVSQKMYNIFRITF